MVQVRFCSFAGSIILTALLLGPGERSKAASTGEDEAHRIIASAKLALNVHDQTFSGPGWELIQKEVVAAQLIAVGEDHLTREVPEVVSALCDALGPKSLAAMAVETGPEVASFIQRRLSSDRHEQDMADLIDRYPDSVAFFDIGQENNLLTHCAVVDGRAQFEIWGLDQEFFGAGGWLLDMILDEPLSQDARAAIEKLRAEEARDADLAKASGDPGKLFLFSVSDDRLEAAQKLLTQGGGQRSLQLLASILTTHRIYKENAAGSPRANLDRAVLLKKELLSHLDVWQGSGKGGKILLKFGDWHLYRGYNPLGQRDLGNFVAEYADVKDTPSLHIAVLGSRGVHASYGGYGKALEHSAFVMSDDPRYQWLKVAAEVAGPNSWAVFDLHRLRGPVANALPKGWRELSDGYDLLVLAPEISPASKLGNAQR
jgi:hypothetical protein